MTKTRVPPGITASRISYKLPDSWKNDFRQRFGKKFSINDHFFDSLEEWLLWYVCELHILQETVFDTKPVLVHLDKIEKELKKIEANGNEKQPPLAKIRTCFLKLSNLFAIPDVTVHDPKKIAAYLALVHVNAHMYAILNPSIQLGNKRLAPDLSSVNQELSFVKSVHEQFRQASQTLSGIDYNELGSPIPLPSSIPLYKAVMDSIEHFKNLPDAQAGKLVPEGRKHLTVMFGSKPFEFKPDPVSLPYARPEKDAQRKLVAILVQLYRNGGGTAYLQRDGTGPNARKPSPFMRFLDVVKEALPEWSRPEGTAFHSLAQEIIKAEKSK